jgi:hypothetical protein
MIAGQANTLATLMSADDARRDCLVRASVHGSQQPYTVLWGFPESNAEARSEAARRVFSLFASRLLRWSSPATQTTMAIRPRLFAALAAALLLFLSAELYLRHSASISTYRAVSSYWTTYGFGHAPPPWLWPRAPSAHAPLSIRLAIISRPGEREHRDAMRRAVLADVPQEDVRLTYRFFVGVPAHPERFHELAEQPEGVENSLREETAAHGDIELLDLGEGRLYMGTKRWMMLKWVRQIVLDLIVCPH